MSDPIAHHIRAVHNAVEVFGGTLKKAAAQVEGLTAREILDVLRGVKPFAGKVLILAARGEKKSSRK